MNKIFSYIAIIIMIVIASCAQQGSPTGGPKDEDPPKVVNAEPANYSTNFSAKKIQIEFDEYIDMGNFTQELVVSPPMDEKPEIKLKNKTLIIEFEEELKEDVTYTFNFGEGIKDLNEKNILMNFEYVFSTGDRLDSLSIKGTLKNAFDLTIPESPIFVMLYNQLNDSLPLIEIPYYVGRTDPEGNYAVNNLRADVYKMFVLKDGNNNFLFDLPTEEIAFLDTSVFVDADYFKEILLGSGKFDSSDFVIDTSVLAIDTVGMSLDSIQMVLDSIQQTKPDLNSVFIDMYMFTEASENQYLVDYSRDERRKFDLVFNLPLTDTFSYKPLFPEELSSQDFISDFGLNRDSLTIWMGDTSIASYDTIRMSLSYTLRDSMELPYTKLDTLVFSFKEKSKPNKKKDEEAKPDEKKSLVLKKIKNNGVQHINKDLVFSLSEPLREIDGSMFNLFIVPDTIDIPIKIEPAQEESHLKRAFASNKWEEDAQYHLVIYPGAMTNIYEETNDTIDVKFRTSSIVDYGKLLVELKNIEEDPVIIQLYIKDKLSQERIVSDSGEYVFEYLNPATYTIKLITDRNRNGEWDTGKYMKDLQPEKVEFVPNTIEVRANWDHNVSYIMGSSNSPVAKEKKENSDDKDKSAGKSRLDTTGTSGSNSSGGSGKNSTWTTGKDRIKL